MGCAIGPELLLRQFPPRSSGVQDPKYAAQNLSIIAPRAPLARLLLRQELSNALPLGVGEDAGLFVRTGYR